jgi:long-chain fatty acid transport protein
MHAQRLSQLRCYLFAVLASLSTVPAALGQGSVVPAVGAINRSMAGTAVAAPLDAAGAIYHNPASMTGLDRSEMLISTGLAYGVGHVTSSLPANAFGPGIPATPQLGSTQGDTGIAILPNTALLYRPPDSRWRFGAGGFAAAGVFDNFPADPNNPVLSARPPLGFANGPLYTSAAFAQFFNVASYALTDHLSIGFGPTVTAAAIQVDPAAFVPPNDADGDGRPNFPAATHGRLRWGAGLVAGVYLTTDAGWRFGASVKSPQWMETFKFNAADENGLPLELSLRVDFPLIVTVGTAYSGLEGWLFALDVRYIDFKGTDGLGESAAFDPTTGRVLGIGWDSVVSVSAGVQYQLSDCWSLRVGYLWSDNTVQDEDAFFNISGAVLYEHLLCCGASYQFTEAMKFSFAYVHIVRNDIIGQFQTPFGPVPGSSVQVDQQGDAIDFTVSVNF